MHKKIFKISTVAFLGLMTFGYAQTTTPYEGKVGINNETPKATLEITAYQNTGRTKEGLLIPRLTKSVAKTMVTQFPNSGNNKIEESTLIYVTDNVGTGDNAQFVGTGKGFYYFDATAYKWTKLGTGGSGATVAVPYENMRGKVTTLRKGGSAATGVVTDATAVNYIIQPGDFLIVTNNAEVTTIRFPETSVAEKGRTIHLFNNNTITGGLVLRGKNDNDDLFRGQTTTNQWRGRTFVSDGEKWVGIAL